MTNEAGSSASGFRPWKEGVDEAVFVAFNPAYSLPGIRSEAFYDKRDEARGWSRFDASKEAFLRNFDPLPPDSAKALRGLSRWFDHTSKHERCLVSWREMQAALGIADLVTFWRALEAVTVGYSPDESASEMVAIRDLIDQRGLFEPEDQKIQPSIESAIGVAFKNAGCRTLNGSDVFGNHLAEFSVLDLIDGPSIQERVRSNLMPIAALWDERTGIACSVGFDSVCTIFRARIAAMKASQIDRLLEGIWIEESDPNFSWFWWPSDVWPEVKSAT